MGAIRVKMKKDVSRIIVVCKRGKPQKAFEVLEGRYVSYLSHCYDKIAEKQLKEGRVYFGL